MSFIVSLICAVIGAWIMTAEAMYAFYWIFGTWIPWYAGLIGAVAAPIVAPVWIILWLLHFAPQMHWPLVAMFGH